MIIIMKLQFIILAAFSIISINGKAQVKDSKEISTGSLKAVVIEANDETSIQRSAKDLISISSYLFKKGKIRGLKSPSERPDFRIECAISNDTLYLASPAYYSPVTIGINTYSERIETNIEIPGHIPVIITNSKNLVLKDPLSNVKVLKADKVIYNNLKTSEISTLKCRAKETLLINNITRSREFEMEGRGTNQIRIDSREIEINTID